MTLTLILSTTAIASETTKQYTSFFDLLVQGGVVMIPIFVLSLISIYVFAEKLIYIRKCSKFESDFAKRVVIQLSKNDKEQALLECRKNNSMGNIFENGIDFIGKPIKEIDGIMESTANVEVARMERHIGYLGVIAGIAPMLGFIGTMSGVIKIFYNISVTDNISIGIIAGGLYQKMITSGAGLIVGVVAYACYHYLHMQIDKFSAKLQEESLVFIKSLQK